MSMKTSAVGAACAGGATAIMPVTARARDPRKADRRLREEGFFEVIRDPFGKARQPCLRRGSSDDRCQTSHDKVTDGCDSANSGGSPTARVACSFAS